MFRLWKNFVYVICVCISVVNAKIIINNLTYYNLPRFWTNTGFCPTGDINHNDITNSLICDDIKINFAILGALPNQGISHVRIHWLLELINFVGFEKHGIPEYDFTQLDTLINWLDNEHLSVGFEFMGNPGKVFFKNKTNNSYLWEDLSFQISKRYLNRYGEKKIQRWKYESWNEPDLKSYNLLNWTTNEYHQYLHSLRRGLNAGGRRPLKNIHWSLHGPAGLFKAYDHHPLCWSILEKCNNSSFNCPFDVLTFHRKGNGDAIEILEGSQILLDKIFEKFPLITKMRISNNEADPVAGWSTPRDFQSNVRYAVTLIQIVFDHWSAKINKKEFKNLESISHDNAFLSYHPYEFNQRTLLARFQMNNTKPKPNSQFIQKPVYASLGLLSQLGNYAADIINIDVDDCKIQILKSSGAVTRPLYQALMVISTNIDQKRCSFILSENLRPTNLNNNETFAYINEIIEFDANDPVSIWKFYNSPPYPNATIRKAMRRSQGPQLESNRIINENQINLKISLRSPWISLIRICSSYIYAPTSPVNVQILSVTSDEVLITWKENGIQPSDRCIKTYEVFFSASDDNWINISNGWHVPFMLFHFQPIDKKVKGGYKIRSIDIFQRAGEFSKVHYFL